MRRSEGRILTTHVGSLIRPTAIAGAAGKAAPPPVESSAGELGAAISEVVKQQRAVGLDIINDGEFGKSGWSNYVLERVSGFEVRPNQLTPLRWLGRDRERFADFFAEEMPAALTGAPAQVCIAPLRYRGGKDVRSDTDHLSAAVATAGIARSDAFITAVAPASAAYNGVNEYYASEREYVFALATALRDEYRAIYEAGFLVQVDDAVLANMFDALTQEGPGRYREWAELRIEALNFALADIPVEAIRYHICFGSWHVPHVADAPFAEIVEFMLQVKAQAYSFEAANVRHEQEWRVWQDVKLPAGKILMPGVVTHHTGVVEHPRLVADRIVRFAELVGRENVIACTDCGFSQSSYIHRTHVSVMWAKLQALVEGARIASKELF